MSIDTNGQGSFLFQSLDASDQALYTYDQTGGNTFNPVTTLTIGSLGTTLVLKFINLPTANPHVNNQIWSNSGVLTVSSG